MKNHGIFCRRDVIVVTSITDFLVGGGIPRIVRSSQTNLNFELFFSIVHFESEVRVRV